MPSSSRRRAARYRLVITAPDDCTHVEIVDGNLQTVPLEESLGEIAAALPAGVYGVRFYRGQGFVERTVILSPQSPRVEVFLDPRELPELVTAAPVATTSTPRESQCWPARELSRSRPTRVQPVAAPAGESRLLLFLRNPFGDDGLSASLTVHALDGEKLFDLGDGEHDRQHQWIGAHLGLPAGAYRLRQSRRDRQPIEQLVFTPEGWQTQAFFLASGTAGGESDIVRSSILLARFGVGFDFERDDLRWTESALHALENNRNVPGKPGRSMWWAKFENPVLGIYSGLLHLRRRDVDHAMMRALFDDLYELIGPVSDVLAIGWAVLSRNPRLRSDRLFIAKLRQREIYGTPPMLRESWSHLVRASAGEPGLIPESSLADRIGGLLMTGSPWLLWSTDVPPVQEPPTRRATADGSTAPVVTGIVSPETTIWTQLSAWATKVWQGAVSLTLRASLQRTLRALQQDPEARYWLETRRFTDLERRVAFWLHPPADLRLAPALDADPAFAAQLEAGARERAASERRILEDLSISSGTAIRACLSLINKLVVWPLMPTKAGLDYFVRTEGRGHDVFMTLLSPLRSRTTPVRHAKSGRVVNRLELLYLYYYGSAAERGLGVDTARCSTGGDRWQDLAALLGVAGFVTSSREPCPDPQVLSLEHADVRKTFVESLASAADAGTVTFPPRWQDSVLPRREDYTVGHLLPLFTTELAVSDSQPPPASSGSI